MNFFFNSIFSKLILEFFYALQPRKGYVTEKPIKRQSNTESPLASYFKSFELKTNKHCAKWLLNAESLLKSFEKSKFGAFIIQPNTFLMSKELAPMHNLFISKIGWNNLFYFFGHCFMINGCDRKRSVSFLWNVSNRFSSNWMLIWISWYCFVGVLLSQQSIWQCVVMTMPWWHTKFYLLFFKAKSNQIKCIAYGYSKEVFWILTEKEKKTPEKSFHAFCVGAQWQSYFVFTLRNGNVQTNKSFSEKDPFRFSVTEFYCLFFISFIFFLCFSFSGSHAHNFLFIAWFFTLWDQ